MEIYFDRKTTQVIRYIHKHPYVKLKELQSKFGEYADSYLLANMCRSLYIVCLRGKNTYVTFDDTFDGFLNGHEKFAITPKGRKMLEDRFSNIWQWAIPTIISVIALAVSVLDVICS